MRTRCSGRFQGLFRLAHRRSVQCDAVGGVDDAVEDGVGQGGIADDLVPMLDRHLAGDDEGSPATSVLGDFEEIPPVLRQQGLRSKIVENQYIDLRQRGQQLGMAAVAPGQVELGEQPGHAMVLSRGR